MKYEWYSYPNYYTSEECDSIVATYSADLSNTKLDDTIRRSKVSWIHDIKIQEKIVNTIRDANINAFNFNIDYSLWKPTQFTEYDETYKGHYREHIDSYLLDNCEDGNKKGYYDRKLSLVVALTDPKEYEGGDFLLYSLITTKWTEIELEKGTALVFPSFFPHRVTPVIKGKRNTLVSWAEGEHFR